MSTENSPPHHRTPRDAGPEEPTKPTFDLSLTQVLGGALAAMTAAFLGSRLSVAGTVVGAAMASIVAAVAGNLYTASLRSTRERVRTVWQGRTDQAVPTTVEAVADRDVTSTWTAPAQPSAPSVRGSATSPRTALRGRLSWRNVLLGALSVFALAAVAVTGLELATGSSLSGQEGTTVTQVTEPRRASSPPDATPSAEPSASSATPTPTASAEPTAGTPSAVAPSTTGAPTPVPETTEPTPTPSATASTGETPSASPTPSAESTPDGSG